MAGHSRILVDPGTTTGHATFQRSDGTNTNEVDKNVQDEAFQPSYKAVASNVALATANSHPFEIMAGATNKVILQRVQVWQAANATSIQQLSLRVVRLSTAGTSGVAVTPSPLDPADSASGATVMILPSAKGTEGVAVAQRRGMVHTTAATVGINPIADFDYRGFRHKGLVIAAGTSNGVALKNITSDAAGTVDIEVDFTELPYSV